MIIVKNVKNLMNMDITLLRLDLPNQTIMPILSLNYNSNSSNSNNNNSNKNKSNKSHLYWNHNLV